MPLKFQLVAQPNSTFPAHVTASPMEGTVSPNGSQNVSITVEQWREQAATGQQVRLTSYCFLCFFLCLNVPDGW